METELFRLSGSNYIKNIKQFIEYLPIDIKNKIIEEYIKPELIINEFNQTVKSTSSKELKYFQFKPILKKVLNCKISINYLVKNHNAFKIAYKSHFIEKNKYFTLLTIDNSFALTILMILYH